MKNLNNKKTLEMINKIVISQYVSNLKNIKTESVKLFKTFLYTGAPNLSEPATIILFENLENLLLKRFDFSNN